MSSQSLDPQLDQLTALVADRLRDAKSALAALHNNVQQRTGVMTPRTDFAAELAHLLVLMARFDRTCGAKLRFDSPLCDWLRRQQAFPWPSILDLYAVLEHDLRDHADSAPSPPAWDEYGLFLGHHDQAKRTKRGVYYTPPSLADFVISEVDSELRRCTHLGLEALSQDDTRLRIEDPAVGSGVFLLAVLRRLEAEATGLDLEERRKLIRRAVGRLRGVDILMPACGLSYLRIAHWLFRDNEPNADVQLDIQIGNSLLRPSPTDADPYVLLGNPPFSGISQNRDTWIDELMRDPQHGFYHVNGEKLDERKLWLNDDYVKFFRMAHHRLQNAGRGVIAFVTSHAMLDNASFRAMRRRLLESFSHVRVVDLHGSRKRDERTASGRPDANLFDIEQGIAITVLTQTGGRETPTATKFAELWGERDDKLDRLRMAAERTQPLSWQPIQPAAPHFLFRPTNASHDFQSGAPLPDVFEVHSTAPVTARDRLVVARTKDELLRRIERFRDLTISDEEIRRDWFPRRSSSLQRVGRRRLEYAAGDTRGWRLGEARRRLAADPNWKSHVRPCLYRPFDHRFVYWSHDMIDWPRPAVTKHFVDNDNLVLIARRMTPPNASGVYLWICTGLTLDGVIRSDNRGSESIFPLWRHEDGQRCCNLSDEWIAELESRIGRSFSENASAAAADSTISPNDIAAYLYAQLQSAGYQQQFRENLHQEFPRVFLPADAATFDRLADAGRRLIALHLTTPPAAGDVDGEAGFEIRSPYPRWSDSTLQLSPSVTVHSVSEEAWSFRVGTHQVCRKWWRDRRGQNVGRSELEYFEAMAAAISETLAIRRAIAGAVDPEGCWRI